MHEERTAYINAIRRLDGDLPGRRAALEFMAGTDATAHGELIEFPFVPYLFNADDRAFLEREMTTIHRILCKLIDAYLKHPSYRELFCFPPEVDRLIRMPCGYSQLLPLCRLDFFLDEDDRSYKFCEFNTDGSGAMSRDAEMASALMGTPSFESFAAGHGSVRPFELFDSWVAAFLSCWREHAATTGAIGHAAPAGAPPETAPGLPSVAITDFTESGVMSDFTRFISAFERAGCSARFTDARHFTFDGEHLRDAADGRVIDAIYRRAVTSELIGHLGECQPLIDAVREQKVCLVGHFRTTVVHSKMVNVALFDERTAEFLEPAEIAFIEEHVPRTWRLRTDGRGRGFDVDRVLADKDSWIIKPEDDYGAHGVYPGVDCTEVEWRELVASKTNAGYVAQEYCRVPEVPIVNTRVWGADEDGEGGDPLKVELWQSMPGAYLYNGEMAGLYCRLGQEGVIALDHGGLCAPSFRVD